MDDDVLGTSSRRDVLKAATALGVSGGFLGAGAGSAAAYQSGPRDTWGAMTSDYDVVEAPQSNKEIRQRRHHTLDYIGSSWEPYGNPVDPGSGCWQHTFQVAGTAATVQTDKSGKNPEIAGTVLESYAAARSGDELNATGDPADNVAIAGRHDADYIGFLSSPAFEEFLESHPDVMSAIAVDPASRPTVNSHTLLQQAEQQRQVDTAREDFYLSVLNLVYDIIPTLSEWASLADVGIQFAEFMGTSLGMWDATEKWFDDGVPPSTITIDEGFSISRPNTGDTGVGGHYMTFDVYVSPGTTGSFLVESGFAGGDHPKRWELSVDAPPAPDDPSTLPTNPSVPELDPNPADRSAKNFTEPPTAQFSRSLPAFEYVELGQTVDYDASPSKPGSSHIANFDWRLYEYGGKQGDISTADVVATGDGVTFDWTFDTSGEYGLWLTATGADGATDSCFTNFTVGDTPRPRIEAPEDPVIDAEYTFEAAVEDTDSSVFDYEWTVEGEQLDNGETDTGKKLPWTFHYEGAYTVSLTVTDDTGRTGTATRTLQPEDKPIAEFELVDAPVPGEALTFDAAASRDPNGEIVAFDWEAETGATGSGEQFEATFEQGGYYDVTLQLTDDEGNTAARTREIDITDAPTASLSATPETVASDIDGEPDVTFTADVADPDGSVSSIEWGGDVPQQDQPRPAEAVTEVSTSFDQPGERTARIVVTDDVGATTTATATVTVENRAPTVELDANSTLIQPEESVTFTASPNDPDGDVQLITWEFPDGATDTWISGNDERARATFTDPDTVETVTVAVFDDEGAQASASVDIYVDTDDDPTVYVSASSETVKTGERVTFTANGSDDVDSTLSYEWSGDVSGSGSRLSTRFHSGGKKTATVTATDSRGNTGTGSKTITVESENLDSGGDGGSGDSDDSGGGGGGRVSADIASYFPSLGN